MTRVSSEPLWFCCRKPAVAHGDNSAPLLQPQPRPGPHSPPTPVPPSRPQSPGSFPSALTGLPPLCAPGFPVIQPGCCRRSIFPIASLCCLQSQNENPPPSRRSSAGPFGEQIGGDQDPTRQEAIVRHMHAPKGHGFWLLPATTGFWLCHQRLEITTRGAQVIKTSAHSRAHLSQKLSGFWEASCLGHTCPSGGTPRISPTEQFLPSTSPPLRSFETWGSCSGCVNP